MRSSGSQFLVMHFFYHDFLVITVPAFSNRRYLIFNFWVGFSNSNILESGESVSVEDEVVVINSIVLPNKTLNVSVQEEIIL